MKSRTSLFNRTVFTNMLRRYWLLFVLYGGALGGTVLLHLANSLHEAAYGGYAMAKLPHYGSLIRLMDILPGTIVIPAVAAPVIAALLFSYLYNSRHTGMMTSLPIKRETMYLSVSAAAIAGVTLANAAVLLMALALELAFGQVHLGALAILFGVLTLSFLTFWGMSVFCCMLTGNILAGPAVYLIFNFLCIGVEAIIHNLTSEFVYGKYGYDYVTEPLSPLYYLVSRVRFAVEYTAENALGAYTDYVWHMEGMGLLVLYAVIGLVILGLGLLLYKHRRMETAGDTVSIEILKPVFRACMTVGAGLVFAVLVMELLYDITPTHTAAAAYIAVLLIVGGTLGYFISKMLIERTADVFRTGWKAVGIYALCVVAVIFSIEFDLYGYERRVPDAADVESVQISLQDGMNYLTFEEEENIAAAVQLHKNILANRDLHEAENGSPHAKPVDFSEKGAAYRKTRVVFTYGLKNGDTLTRKYNITWTPDEIRNNHSEIRALERLINTEEAIACRYKLDFPVAANNISNIYLDYADKDSMEYVYTHGLTHEDAVELYNECILPDMEDGNMGYIHLVENIDYATSKYQCTIYLEFQEAVVDNAMGGRTVTNYRHMPFYPTLDAERTMAFLAEHGIEPATVYDKALQEGRVFCELGVYTMDDTQSPDKEIFLDDPYRGTTAETSAAIIGGADGPTEIVLID